MSDETIKCDEPAGGPIGESAPPQEQATESGEVKMTVARAGSKAPDFQANAYQDGGFSQVKLSDYAGKWTILCFYPGDFTFV